MYKKISALLFNLSSFILKFERASIKFIHLHSELTAAKMKSVSVIILLAACYLAVEFSVAQAAATREKRDTKSDIQKELTDYASSIGKSSSQMQASVAKYLQEQGKTLVDVHAAFQKGGASAQQMKQNLKNAIAG